MKILTPDNSPSTGAIRTDTDIVTGLRSEDSDRRQAALEALFPAGAGAVLIEATAASVSITATRRMDAGRVFNALLWVAQNVGRHLGLMLGWVPDPAAADATRNQIVVAPADALKGS